MARLICTDCHGEHWIVNEDRFTDAEDSPDYSECNSCKGVGYIGEEIEDEEGQSSRLGLMLLHM